MKKTLNATLICLLLYTVQVFAQDGIYNQDGLAIGGYDPVAYFTEERPVWGRSDLTHDWQGVTWQFASKKHRDLFIENPEKYAPQYGGYCAYAAAKGSLAPTDARAWKIVNDKLYLNYSPAVQARWKQNMFGYISRADSNWRRLKKQ